MKFRCDWASGDEGLLYSSRERFFVAADRRKGRTLIFDDAISGSNAKLALGMDYMPAIG